MANYIAVKFHYDHRASLPHYLKYSREPTVEEYQHVLNLYYNEGIGGEGFHECLNFNKYHTDHTKVYLPPGYIPAADKCNDGLIIFSFTYKEDKELPASIIGIHAGVSILSREQGGIERKDIKAIKEIGNLCYHATAPNTLTTLFSTPLEYNFKEGNYTPIYRSWGNGLRYIEESHAIRILKNALRNAIESYKKEKSKEKLQYIQEEINVITTILKSYFNITEKTPVTESPSSGKAPDKEIGYLGEEYVFNQELKYAKENGINPVHIQWISQSIPSSVYDIKTVRKNNGKLEDHYLEVKSTKMSDYNNVYVSSRQIGFFEKNPKNSTFIFLKFNSERKVIEINDYNIQDIKNKFNLNPIKYRLAEK